MPSKIDSLQVRRKLFKQSNPLATMLRVALVLCSLLSITGCNLIDSNSSPSATATQVVIPTQNTATSTPPAVTQPTPAQPASIRVWIPPQFDPNSGTAAGEIMSNRLDLFTTLNPGVQVEVRIKAEDGQGGLLDSLSTANIAAPLALPDLVLLSRPMLEIAAIKGFVKPLGSIEKILEDDDWYGYAQQLSRLQESAFGLPFAGEAEMVVYRRADISPVPKTWEDVLKVGDVLGFPAGDPQALFTLAQYQAAGGTIQDDQGRPSLDEATLADVLLFYQKAQQSGVFPFWLTQFETDSQAWDAWKADQFSLNVVWSTQYLQQGDETGVDSALIPTRSGQPFTLARGWAWAVASPNATRQLWALRLLKHLSDPAFLGQWSAAAGYLPPRRAALAEWPDGPRKEFVGSLAESSNLYPPENLLTVLGPILRQATFAVLRQQVDPVEAASQAVDQLK